MIRLKSLSIDLQRFETASTFSELIWQYNMTHKNSLVQMKRTSSQPLLGSNETMPVQSSELNPSNLLVLHQLF